MTFTQKLNQAWHSQNSLLMVGLDPDMDKLPHPIRSSHDALWQFCKGIVDATAPYVCGFKPQVAYFASLGAEDILKQTCEYIRTEYPNLVLMLDAKRGDIGSTAEHYAREAFDRYQADAVTINPYMGMDSAQPYLDRKDKGVIVLCRTSNPGGSDLQALQVNGRALYLHVATLVATQWNQNGQCGLVVGATFPDELRQVRACVGADMPLLVPGIGAQGGDIQATCDAGCNPMGTGMMINSSRAILYASRDEDWQHKAAQAARQTRDAINSSRAK
ncbi:orotidine-5'-phosphate decarboxylase [Orrella daihaiensis]|uniref:Orotidine 5'-phosphate decarboxylase n=1 Tax=Orrella daihaiensis TaxID=2782176 RepID=A0ABY4AKI7_9BURK|nr:orotidine-5'-phosphate decarboxylase [Orrella daihaiensis]UOD50806.1 orotidine-5'-phosphate decarboxylase [Orrella daihaiensis]